MKCDCFYIHAYNIIKEPTSARVFHISVTGNLSSGHNRLSSLLVLRGDVKVKEDQLKVEDYYRHLKKQTLSCLL